MIKKLLEVESNRSILIYCDSVLRQRPIEIGTFCRLPIIDLIGRLASSSLRATNRASLDQLQNATSKVFPAFLRHLHANDQQLMNGMFRQLPNYKHSCTILEINRRSEGLQPCFFTSERCESSCRLSGNDVIGTPSQASELASELRASISVLNG
jgi:hypothetical protein